MVVDSVVALMMVVHVDEIVNAGSDETCRSILHQITEFTANSLGELTWNTGGAFELY